MNAFFFLCFLACIALAVYFPLALKHDAELPISHTGKATR